MGEGEKKGRLTKVEKKKSVRCRERGERSPSGQIN